MKKIKILFILILSLLLISCGDKEETVEKVEQIFYTAMPKQEYNLNPQSYTGNERALITQIFEGLTELKDEGTRYVEVLNIEHSDDFKEWIFTLRDDLKWSDNQKITAETYLESWLNTLEN